MKRVALFAACAATIAAPAAAHHGWSSYDETRPIRVTAPLTAVAWSNPHGTARVAYRGASWAVVLAPVARMQARGLTRAMIAPGRPVTLVGYARRDGTREMRIERVIAGQRTIELR